jgi:hypothetical protein
MALWEENVYELATPENMAPIIRKHHENRAVPKIQKFMREKFAQKWMRNRAARPPGTEGPNNTGGELYKVWATKAANHWPKTRKGRKGRKNRKSRRRN